MTKQEQIDYLLSVIRVSVDTLVDYDYWTDGQADADLYYENIKKDIGYEKS